MTKTFKEMTQLKGLLMTAEHIGFMEGQAGMTGDYKILELRDELEEMVLAFLITWCGGKEE
jgi:hypothetical protein